MLSVAEAWFGYDAAPVVRGVSMSVPPGGFVGILGPNGSGKTTLLRLLAGTLRPERGRITLDGEDMGSLPRAALARRMAVVPQETQLAFDYSVLEVALMGRYPHLGPFAIEGPADVAIAREALAATGTLPFARRDFSTLSGGEKQRVIIASALAQIQARDPASARTSLLLLDEPTAALDLGYQLDVASLLRELQARRSLAIVISTHDLNFAAGLCQSLVLLRDGRVLAAGETEAVLTPSNVRALYGVEADVSRHPRTGRLTVVPIARAAEHGA